MCRKMFLGVNQRKTANSENASHDTSRGTNQKCRAEDKDDIKTLLNSRIILQKQLTMMQECAML